MEKNTEVHRFLQKDSIPIEAADDVNDKPIPQITSQLQKPTTEAPFIIPAQQSGRFRRVLEPYLYSLSNPRLESHEHA